jgi:hypothetical protein
MRFALAIGLLAASLLASCRAPLEGAPCPCLVGFACSLAENVCVPVRSGTPDSGADTDASYFPDGGFPDGAPSDSSPTPDADLTPDAGEPFPDAGDFDASFTASADE